LPPNRKPVSAVLASTRGAPYNAVVTATENVCRPISAIAWKVKKAKHFSTGRDRSVRASSMKRVAGALLDLLRCPPASDAASDRAARPAMTAVISSPRTPAAMAAARQP